MKIHDNQIEIIQMAGQMAESIGFNRSVGQIYATLYISADPLSLTDIARKCGMSKGNASLNLRALESWGMVEPIAVQGSRRDHYAANRNLKQILTRRIQEGIGRRLALADEKLTHILANLDRGSPDQQSTTMKTRVQEIHSMVTKGKRGLDYLPKILAMLNW